jgi:hypothetical protein
VWNLIPLENNLKKMAGATSTIVQACSPAKKSDAWASTLGVFVGQTVKLLLNIVPAKAELLYYRFNKQLFTPDVNTSTNKWKPVW